MVFRNNTPNEKREVFTTILNIPTINRINTYLGLPTVIGKSKFRSFNFLLDRLRNILKIWKGNTFSYTGRATMIKEVARDNPSYVMSSFLLPKILSKKMKSLTARFWWG